ncbi:MAG TPA: cystathionine gamma-synthase [Algoriphagus sp.]|jgi:cystathionine beta-lyase|uniref:cystathionine gamma-synthase n=1 Tax=unclassified Algoriphagus TaxID=2641541 RepID=UPI000C53BB53|nr:MULTISPECIES: cystathionine gamma-synthase [unclassified Algoriphagus]MAL13066.1 cystathionine gamma-synthase [Algoriphagus sp.]QYH39420.1 cystathionine gamma-synthase [Algoriphagus sp. NBT04N3]HAS60114.1 cystathionine gamma-synthase [Algoriphagus sp.]HCB47239.1 cystathionine gamma-synthase [Algoriphagus sp.]HCD88687.1 cystathionine gamma-synthase [Algoriphagus sp.]|tara:strand:- start:5013 stop:6158 length:1146 start_codon:yes stop_codon:yes gene_type:complete
MKFGTKAIHSGVEPDPSTGAIMTPIYQTSTYVQRSPGDHQGYEYSRTHNPTRTALQNNLAALENGKHGICFSSGLGAIDAVIKLFNPGDEIISTSDLYGGTYRLFTKVYEKYGIKFHFVPMTNVDLVAEKINENTKMIWAETPTNPMMNIVDLRALSKLAKGNNLLLGVDNTFASPFLQNPLDLGADIVMHSVTKYLGGHSDVVMGALVVNEDELAQRLIFIQNACGAVPGPQDCFLVLRGIKTLHIRMERHSQNGKTIAAYLKNHPKVEKVYWPGFEDHPNHDIAKSQMRDFGGMISFSLKGNKLEDARKVMESFKLFSLAESLGGVESLCGHPATMTHASIPKEEREKVGLVDSLIRLSVGIEDAEDLKNDLAFALSRI